MDHKSIEMKEEFLKPPQLFCKGKQKITKICCSVECENPSFHCESSQCGQCWKAHIACFKFDLQGLTDILNKRISWNKKNFENFIELEEKIISKLRYIRDEINQKIEFGWMQNNYQQLIKQLYVKRNHLFIKGSQSFELCTFIKEQYEQFRQLTDQTYQKQVLAQYDRQSNDLALSYLLLKQDTINKLFVNRKSQMQLNSKIVDNKLNTSILEKWLLYPKKATLIFRASDHNFQSKKFHQLCDSEQNTLILIRNQFNKIFGGFTPLNWNSANSNYAKDESKKSFIFSLSSKIKMKLGQSEKSICCNKKYGPTFGGGHDLHISNSCDKNRNSYVNLPQSYHFLSYQWKGKQVVRQFCGGQNFRVIQYQVFKIDWN